MSNQTKTKRKRKNVVALESERNFANNQLSTQTREELVRGVVWDDQDRLE